MTYSQTVKLLEYYYILVYSTCLLASENIDPEFQIIRPIARSPKEFKKNQNSYAYFLKHGRMPEDSFCPSEGTIIQSTLTTNMKTYIPSARKPLHNAVIQALLEPDKKKSEVVSKDTSDLPLYIPVARKQAKDLLH